MIEYPDENEDETLMGYLARPEGDEAAPAIIVIQEWWGLNDHIMDVTNRFAQQGYVALAPDLYKGEVATEPDEARKLVMEVDMPEAVREIQSAITYLLDQEYVSGDRSRHYRLLLWRRPHADDGHRGRAPRRGYAVVRSPAGAGAG